MLIFFWIRKDPPPFGDVPKIYPIGTDGLP